MAKLVMMSGIPGCGKSTFSVKLQHYKKSHVYIVASDAVRTNVSGYIRNVSNDSTVWEIFYELIKAYSVDKEGIVIVDATNLDYKVRKICKEKVFDYFDDISIVSFAIDPQIAIERNRKRKHPVPEDVVIRFLNEFSLPNEEEAKWYNHQYIIKNPKVDVFRAIKKICD